MKIKPCAVLSNMKKNFQSFNVECKYQNDTGLMFNVFECIEAILCLEMKLKRKAKQMVNVNIVSVSGFAKKTLVQLLGQK